MFYKILQNGNIIHDNDCLQYGLYTVHATEDSPNKSLNKEKKKNIITKKALQT